MKILETKHFEEILKLFPQLSEFVVKEEDIRFYHEKDKDNNFYQVFGTHFTLEQLNGFIKKYLIDNVRNNLKQSQEPSKLCINVRRGDFYEKGNSSIYGYDQIGFIRHVFEVHLSSSYFQNIKIVSDNMMWCRQELQFLKKYTAELTFPDFQNPVTDSFLEVINSEELILSNSTFSFWAAYISNYMYENTQQTYCPIFGSRKIKNTDLYQTNPNWNIISDFNFNQF
ncbi:alpha-1,2-fucosyltransferase [Chryseobacterium sp. FH1]|uniref:alpha-1,2-fucosyltransferase n=1 Tax=Chryseobacterium sp. FH1 TaxID=1233951 RepID=UPI0013F42F1C|nr:alpha-1,2-fucosyltransferase [Chryseobacterium sp. FH1]